MNQQEIRDAIEWSEQRQKLLGKAIGYMSFENLHAASIVYDSLQEMQDELAIEKIILTALRAQIEPGWIKVSDKEPRTGETVLFWTTYNEVRMGHYDGACWLTLSLVRFPRSVVTHWRELPEPPRGDA